MGTITSGIGLVSGLNTSSIIDGLMKIEERPKTDLETRMTEAGKKKDAFNNLSLELTALKVSVLALNKTSTFNNRSVTSSNESLLTASASAGAAKGTYSFQVSRLVTTQQAVSGGFSSSTDKVGAGTLTFELGGGDVKSQTLLSQLNGGAGVRNGKFRITDGNGNSSVIDISGAVTVDDVIDKINSAENVSVSASVSGDHLTLTDMSGGGSSLTVSEVGLGHAAEDLGIKGTDYGAIAGSQILKLGASMKLSSLNDGLGVRIAGGAANDFKITDGSGTEYNVSLTGSSTLEDVIDAIGEATDGAVTAGVSSDGRSIVLTDTTGGTPTVEALNGSNALKDLGLANGTTNGSILTGRAVVGGIDTVLLSTLRGGSGLDLGTVQFRDRSGNSADLDFTGATTLQDVLDIINNNGTAQITASLKDSGNGIQIQDYSGGTGDLTVTDMDSTLATQLGIEGTHAGQTLVKGANLQRQWINENTLLSSYNGGRGVSAGSFKITSTTGKVATIALDASDKTLGDVISKINAANIDVTASINANGDGLLLTDTGAGTLTMAVGEVTGRTASDLNILSSPTGNKIDGTFEKTLTIGANDTLADVVESINTLAFAASAETINDGTSTRLSLTSRFSGLAGKFVFDAGDTQLGAENIVNAQDAVVFYGSGVGAGSMTISSSTNQITGLIRGVTINLQGASSSTVTLTIGDDSTKIVDGIKSFVENFNKLSEDLTSQTQFNLDKTKRGILMGDATALKIQSTIYNMVLKSIKGSGDFHVLSDMGVTINDKSQLEFDENKLQTALAKDSENVKRFFTLYQDDGSGTKTIIKGMGSLMTDAMDKLIDPSKGVITLQAKSLDNQVTLFQNRIDDLQVILDSKRLRLVTQFATMESTLSRLQSQMKALDSLSNLSTNSNSSKSSS